MTDNHSSTDRPPPLLRMKNKNARIKCECGSIVKNLSIHKKTTKHLDWCARNRQVSSTDQSSRDETTKIAQQIQEYESIIMNAQREINILKSKLRVPENSSTLLSNLIEEQRCKEAKNDMWAESAYHDITKLKSNNIGVVGETFIQKICSKHNIEAHIDGTRMKTRGGGNGDGKNKKKRL